MIVAVLRSPSLPHFNFLDDSLGLSTAEVIFSGCIVYTVAMWVCNHMFHAIVILLCCQLIHSFRDVVAFFVLLLYVLSHSHLYLHFLLLCFQSLGLRLQKSLVFEELSLLEIKIGLRDAGFCRNWLFGNIIVCKGLSLSVDGSWIGELRVSHFIVKLDGGFELHILFLKHHFVDL